MSNSPAKKSLSEYKRNWYLKNKDRISEKGKRDREKNKEIIKIKRKLRREKFKEEIKKEKKEYYLKNKEAINEKRKKEYAENKDGVRDKRHKYVRDNAVKFRMYRANRKAKEKQQLHPDHNKQLEKVLREASVRITNCLKLKFCIDHILPIECGGWHHHLNLQLMPDSLNLRKKNSLIWMHPYYLHWKDLPQFLLPRDNMVGDFDSLLDCGNLIRTVDKRTTNVIGLENL